MRKIWLIRKDQEAVSPVIATILMVAITVVLAAVLYVMVSGLLTGPGAGPRSMGVNIQKSSDGTNWVLTISRTPSGLTVTSTFLQVNKPDGTANMTKTEFALLTMATKGAVYNAGSPPAVSNGDTILLKYSWYPSGQSVVISDSGGILFSSNLQ